MTAIRSTLRTRLTRGLILIALALALFTHTSDIRNARQSCGHIQVLRDSVNISRAETQRRNPNTDTLDQIPEVDCSEQHKYFGVFK